MKIRPAYVAPRAQKATGTRRRVWCPADARAVILACGHTDTDWPFVKAMKILAAEMPIQSVWCERCADWRGVDHYATPAEVAGIVILPLPDECPF